MVEVQKLEVFCDFVWARATLWGVWGGRGAKTRVVFCDFCGARATLSEDRRGRGAKTRGFLRFLRRSREVPKLEDFAFFVVRTGPRGFDSSLVRGRASQAARSNLHTATCADQFAQSTLPRATCAEQLAHTATCTEQLAQSNLRRATCTCPRRWADLACDVMLSGQPWSSWATLPQRAKTNPLGQARMNPNPTYLPTYLPTSRGTSPSKQKPYQHCHPQDRYVSTYVNL